MYEDDLDAEWEDFDKLMAEYNVRKRKVFASPIFQRRHVDDLCEVNTNPQDRHQTAFYPCPPPSGVADDYYAEAPVSERPYLRVWFAFVYFSSIRTVRVGIRTKIPTYLPTYLSTCV